jgi:hypothetical protein
MLIALGTAAAAQDVPAGMRTAAVTPVGVSPVVVSPGVTSVTVQSTARSTQWSVPVTFGQVFAKGDLRADDLLVAYVGTDRLPLQMDVKARHADGSVRHAVITTLLRQLDAGASASVSLVRHVGSPVATKERTAQELLAQGFSTVVSVNLGGRSYHATPDAALLARATPWLSGALTQEWLVSTPLLDDAGVAHPHLSARFAVRWHPELRRAKVDVILENDWAYEPAPQNYLYDVAVTVGAQPVYAKQGAQHFARARWRKSFWWGEEPQLHLRHDIGYLVRTGALPNYDTGLTPSEAGLQALAQQWAAAKKEPMGPGLVQPGMPAPGGRPDIGPLPQWAAQYLLSMDPRAKAATLGIGDLAGSWPIHFRDKATGRPVSLADYPYMTLLGHAGDTVNPKTRKSEAFPACAVNASCSTAPYNYQPDSSHQPSLSYLPYIVTGDHYHLEELQFWANYNMLQANPGYRGYEKGVVKWDQVRGQAWSLRTLGQAAYITPDADPMKAYFSDRVQHNLAWYQATYVEGKPNALGVLDGTNGFAAIAYTTPSGPSTGLSPWMDDFFTWATGYLATGLGFDAARPMAQWKAAFPVGRMTAQGTCWVDGAVYALAVRPSAGAALYTDLTQAYLATMRGVDKAGAAIPLANSTGARYLDQACGSQAQADWRTQLDKDNKTARGPWKAGEMTGYADSVIGFPANMQPALAIAVDLGVPNAQAAWNQFMARSVKPNYAAAPQWAVVPVGSATRSTSTPPTR